MSSQPILSIEAVPGDAPRGMEQPNGDLLVPANVRPLIAKALLQAEEALADQPHALAQARQLLGIEKPEKKAGWLGNLYRLRPI
ncbi:MAG: hypothetical protein ACAH21_08620 [Ramlibacter sp.]